MHNSLTAPADFPSLAIDYTDLVIDLEQSCALQIILDILQPSSTPPDRSASIISALQSRKRARERGCVGGSHESASATGGFFPHWKWATLASEAESNHPLATRVHDESLPRSTTFVPTISDTWSAPLKERGYPLSHSRRSEILCS